MKKLTTFALAALIGLFVAVTPSSAQTRDNFDSSTLNGTWLAVVTFDPNFQLHVLFTFNSSGDDGQGTLIDQNEYQYTPNPVCTADQGVWRKTSRRHFIATHFAYCFDATAGYIPDGSVKVRDNITTSQNGSSFTGTQYIEIFDVDGNLIDTVQATMTGTKLNAAPPPEAGDQPHTSPFYQKLFKFGAAKPNN